MKRNLVILKVKLHLTSHVLGFLPLRREHWVANWPVCRLQETREGGVKGGGTQLWWQKGDVLSTAAGLDPRQVLSPLGICPQGLGENQRRPGGAAPPFLTVNAPASVPPPCSASAAAPGCTALSLSPVAEPLCLRTNILKQLSPTVTPEQPSQPRPLSHGPVSHIPQHRATVRLLNHPLGESSRSTDFRRKVGAWEHAVPVSMPRCCRPTDKTRPVFLSSSPGPRPTSAAAPVTSAGDHASPGPEGVSLSRPKTSARSGELSSQQEGPR